MALSILIIISTFLLAFLCSIAMSLGIMYAAAIPFVITSALLLVLFFKNSEARSAKFLQFGVIAFVASGLMWPRYAAFFLPGLPLINPQRIANAALIVIMMAVLVSNKYLREELRHSFSRFGMFWLFFLGFLFFRMASVVMSEDVGTSIYRFMQEFFVHVIFIVLGVHLGARKENIDQLLKVMVFGLLVVTLIASVEFILKKNVFSYFITPQNEYMAWALSDKLRDGVYRAKGTFDHPLTFSEFVAIATPLAIYFSVQRDSHFKKLLYLAVVVICATTSILLSGSRSGYLAIAITAGITITAPAIFTIIHKRLTLKRAALWSFLLIGVSAILVVGAVIVYEYTLGRGAHSASDQARVEMLVRSMDLAPKSPLYGYGVGLAAQKVAVRTTPLGDYTIDSIYLTFMVESGFGALGMFVLMLVYAIQTSWKSAANVDNTDWLFWSALGTALFSVVTFKSILSLLDNNYLMYILVGIAVSRINSEGRNHAW
jgi:hypothetical protein